MKTSSSKRVLLILPAHLLAAMDEGAQILGISRLGFIRLCLLKSLGSWKMRDQAPSSASMEKTPH
jgi:hypothetical protein